MLEETELLFLHEALGRAYPEATATQRTGYHTVLEGRAQGLTQLQSWPHHTPAFTHRRHC